MAEKNNVPPESPDSPKQPSPFIDDGSPGWQQDDEEWSQDKDWQQDDEEWSQDKDWQQDE